MCPVGYFTEMPQQTYLSYDAVIQRITAFHRMTACHKSYDHTCNYTLASIRNVFGNVHVSNANSFLNNVHYEGDKIPLQKII